MIDCVSSSSFTVSSPVADELVSRAERRPSSVCTDPSLPMPPFDEGAERVPA